MPKIHEAGDTFRSPEGYEFLAKGDKGKGCELCIGDLHMDICDMLPAGCGGNYGIVWVPLNDLAKTLYVVMKLEGKP